jgi:general secretion pathway protein G
MSKRTRRRRGFTLVEVLLVVLILGMLAAVFIVGYGGIQQGAKIDTTRLKMKNIETALENYNLNVGHYPTEDEGGLKALRTKPTFDDEKLAEKWRGPYLREDPTDAWDLDYNYQVLDSATATELGIQFKIWSNGPDKQDGTEDDIRNWTEQR